MHAQSDGCHLSLSSKSVVSSLVGISFPVLLPVHLFKPIDHIHSLALFQRLGTLNRRQDHFDN